MQVFDLLKTTFLECIARHLDELKSRTRMNGK